MDRFDLATLAPEARDRLKSDVLALADSKLVLANWYTTCVHNGRSLPDFAAILGMATATFGHTRGLYLYLVNFGIPYTDLERRRDATAINSMNLLDTPPESWEDFVASVYLAEQAMWTFASGFLSHPDRALSGLVQKIGQESYFHLKYCEGWRGIFAGTENAEFGQAVARRLPQAAAWFGDNGQNDILYDAGLRALPAAKLREAFLNEVSSALQASQIDAKLPDPAPPATDWTIERRRAGNIPDRLFGIVQLKDPAAAYN